MKILITTTMIYLLLLATNVNSDTLFFDTNVKAEAFATLFPPDDIGSLFGSGPDGSDLGDLPQFNPSTGTLVSATLTITGDFSYDFTASADVVLDENLPNSMNANIQFGVGGVVPIGSEIHLVPVDIGTDSISCDDIGFPCSGSASDAFMADTNATFTDSDLAAFIGAGNLDNLSIDLVYGLDSFSSENLVDPFIDVALNFDGTISIQYEFTPVPIPAAVWLFGSGLIGIAGLTRRKKD